MRLQLICEFTKTNQYFCKKNVIKPKAVVTMAHSMHIIGITNQK
jgi:hypothetical protein